MYTSGLLYHIQVVTNTRISQDNENTALLTLQKMCDMFKFMKSCLKSFLVLECTVY